MTGGTIFVAERIIIANNVTVGANATIADTDFHTLDWKQRRLESSGGSAAAIMIEDDVFIGVNCLVLKGVPIGQGSVVGAGSVITKNVPRGTIIAGNPAKMVKELPPEKS